MMYIPSDKIPELSSKLLVFHAEKDNFIDFCCLR